MKFRKNVSNSLFVGALTTAVFANRVKSITTGARTLTWWKRTLVEGSRRELYFGLFRRSRNPR